MNNTLDLARIEARLSAIGEDIAYFAAIRPMAWAYIDIVSALITEAEELRAKRETLEAAERMREHYRLSQLRQQATE